MGTPHEHMYHDSRSRCISHGYIAWPQHLAAEHLDGCGIVQVRALRQRAQNLPDDYLVVFAGKEHMTICNGRNAADTSFNASQQADAY